MKRLLFVGLLLCAGEMFAWFESFTGDDLTALKKIAAESPGASSADSMSDTELKSIVRNGFLTYVKKLKRDQKQYLLLQKKYDEQTKKLESAILAQQNAEAKARDRYIVLSIIAYGALFIGIVLIAGFVYLTCRPHRGGDGNNLTLNADNLHCPRCGWEHGPNETVCKNCKTHF